MKRIKQLSENLINQIAAGEVIERPASVVKEFVENSIDAGATRLEIEISNGCRNIRVADNGGGIHRDDVELAFSRHATSKIYNQDDLLSVATLGFRGEALASIISVAKVTCTTRTADSETGIKVECENSQIKVSETGCAVGTTMDVRDLFYNIPARLKFMKNERSELAAISETVQSIALSKPEIAFTLINNKNSILKTTGSGEIKTTIGEIYSKNIIEEFCEVSKDDKPFKLVVSGFVSNPDFTRSNRKAIYTFINGRTVKCPILMKAIENAYSDMIASGKYPYAVLNLSIPYKDIDINVHPAKREIKYANPNLIFGFVHSAVRAALENNDKFFAKSLLRVETEQDESVISTSYTQTTLNTSAYAPEKNVIDFREYQKSSTNAFSPEIDQDDIQEMTLRRNKWEIAEKVEPKSEIPSVSPTTEDSMTEKPLIIGQMDNTYILVSTSEGLLIVDQHIAHERYLYEKLKEQKNSSNPVSSQLMLVAETVSLDEEDIDLFRENAAFLAQNGYEVEAVSGKGVRLRRVPNILAQKDPTKVVEDILEALQSAPEKIEDELLMRTACRASVKAGEKLSLWQMEELIKNWQSTKHPRTCPHGRKIGHLIPRSELAGYFSRIINT
ncbi:MAG: DNA mismatch repair endonuclease MutL [Candidatus Gastranaerophilales bacterium]|nr:DNA mismatch repair endonuclease MutL [Candidatus Gastranaerophilales bacterium]